MNNICASSYTCVCINAYISGLPAPEGGSLPELVDQYLDLVHGKLQPVAASADDLAEADDADEDSDEVSENVMQ
jgi:hypothetical protein